FLTRISPRQRVFLTRTAVLERMCGPLCEAVLELPGSVATLADLARSNLLLVPLDRRGQWYRYHHMFRDMLLAELERSEPELLPVLRRRAAGWWLQDGLPEEALEYSMAAGDVGGAAVLVEQLALPAYHQGRHTTVQRWLGWLEDRDGVDGHPVIAVHAAIILAMSGRPADVEGRAGRRRAVGQGGRPLAGRGCGPARCPCRRRVDRLAPGHLVPRRNRADARRRGRSRAQVCGGRSRVPRTRALPGARTGPVR